MRLRRLPALLAAAAVTCCALSPALGGGTGPAGPGGTAWSPRPQGGTEFSPGPGGTSTVPVLVATAGTPPPKGTPGTTARPRATVPPTTAPAGTDPLGKGAEPQGTPESPPGPGSGPSGWQGATASAPQTPLDTSAGGSGSHTVTTEPPTVTPALTEGPPSASNTLSPTGTDPAPGGSPGPHGWHQPEATQPDPGAHEWLPAAGPDTTGMDTPGTVLITPETTNEAPGRPDPPATAGVPGGVSPVPERSRGPSVVASGPGGTAGLPERAGTPPVLPSSSSPGAPTAPGPSAPLATSASGGLEREQGGTWGATGHPTPPPSPTARGDPGTAGAAALGTPQPSRIPGDTGTPTVSPSDGTGTPMATPSGDTVTPYGGTVITAAATVSPGSTGTPSPAPSSLSAISTVPGGHPGVFVVEDQPPLLRAPLLRVPCELVLDMGFVPALGDPASREHRGLLRRFNETISPLFVALPGFLRLEVKSVRRGSVVLRYDALFAAARLPPRGPALPALLNATLAPARARLAVGSAPVLRNVALAWPLDPCAELFSCQAGFECVAGADGAARCTSLCHRDYCKNEGVCSHPRGRPPLCRCPVGSDFWFMGLRCDYRVTRQGLLGMACGLLLSVALVGAVVAGLVIRRFRALLLEARADQSKSSYRRFCRLDEVSARFWAQPWLASASSLDNPAFSTSEELLQLHALEPRGGGGGGGGGDGAAGAARPPAPPAARPSSQYEWDTSSSSVNEPMVDSGKASDVSVSSWPLEPLPWAPLPLLQQLSRPRALPARRPRSCGEGTELATLERSWTA